jgi:hypothetical protein
MYPTGYRTGDEDDECDTTYRDYKNMYPKDYRDDDIGDEYPQGYIKENEMYPREHKNTNKHMEHGFTNGDENDTADYLDKRGHGYGSGWPSADVPPWNSHAPINKQTNKHMGDMADYALEQLNWDVEDSYAGDGRPQTPEGFWRQKDGTFIEIKKMTDSHISNSIALCERKGCSFLAIDLVCEQIRREKILDIHRQTRDPVYAAFCAGWNSGHKSAYNEAYPDVGPVGFITTKETAWTQYKKSKTQQ